MGCNFLLYRDLLERDHKRNIDSYKFKMKPSENFTSARRAQLTWESVTRYLFICVGTRVGGTWWSEWGVTEQLQDFLEKFLMQFLGNLQTPSLCMIMNWTRAGLTTLNISFTLFSRLIVCPWDSKHEAYLDHSAVITWELHLNFITLLSSLYEF